MPAPAPLPACVALGRRDLLAALLAAGVLLLCALFRLHPRACGQCHDDGIYVASAKALAEGDGYRLANLPGEPPQTKYPPLYPALLALLWRIWPCFPDNLILLQGLSLICGPLFLGGSYLFLVRFGYASRPVALASCLLCAAHSPFVFFCVVAMSETLFGVLLVAMLWWMESALRSPGKARWNDVLGGVLLGLPFLCRSIGLLFVPLGLLILFQSGKRWRGAALGAVLAVLPWILWSLAAARESASDPLRGYYTDYLGWWKAHGMPALSQVLSCNFLWINSAIGSGLLDGLAGHLREGEQSALWLRLMVLPGLLALGTLAGEVWRGRALATMLLAYLLLAALWPWVPHRFVIPLLPFLGAMAIRAAALPGLWEPLRRVWPVAGRCLFAVLFAASLRQQADINRLRHRDDSPTPEQGPRRHAWAAAQRTFDWLRQHSGPADLVAAGADPTIFLYTGRKAYYPVVCPPLALFYGFDYPRDEVDRLAMDALARLRPRWLVLTPNCHGEDQLREWVGRLRERHPGLLVPAFRDADDPRFEILEIAYPPGFAGSP